MIFRIQNTALIKLPLPEKTSKLNVFNRIAVFLISILILLTLFVCNSDAAGSEKAPHPSPPSRDKSILILYSYGNTLPAYQKVNTAFLTAIQKEGFHNSRVFIEFIDLLNLSDIQQKTAVTHALSLKYKHLNIDLIVALDLPAMGFLQNVSGQFFPDVPVISWNLNEDIAGHYPNLRILPLIAGMDIKGTLELALKLFPKTRQVVFVTGTSQDDEFTEREARQAFSGWDDRLIFEYTTDVSVEKMLRNVAGLPKHSIVIYGSVFRDITGRNFTPRAVCRSVAENANAPVFALYDTLLDQGLIGGSMLSFEAEGKRISITVTRVLGGRISPTMTSQPRKNQRNT